MTQAEHPYAFGTTLQVALDQAVVQVTAALKDEGFGVLTTIDVRHTMKEKLNVDFEPYVILGACNPQLAHRALLAVHDIGLLLPCNVIVYEQAGMTRVEVADPIVMLGILQHPELADLGREARSRLERVITHLGGNQEGER